MTSKQRAYLIGLAMNIDPILQIGKSSLTPEVTNSVSEAFLMNERFYTLPSEKQQKIINAGGFTIYPFVGKRIYP